MAALTKRSHAVPLVVRTLRKADSTVRARSGPPALLRSVLAYLIGFAVLRTAANSWIIMTILEPIVSGGDMRGLSVACALLASVPLALTTMLAKGTGSARHRLALLPLNRHTRLLLEVLSPVITEFPVLVAAAVLPALAALPLATQSTGNWLGVWVWICIMVTGMGFGVRGVVLAFEQRTGNSGRPDHGHTRTIIGILAMFSLMAANPDPGVSADGAFLRLGSRMVLDAGVAANIADTLAPATIPLAIVALAFGFTGLMAGFAGNTRQTPRRTTPGPWWPGMVARLSVHRLPGSWLSYSRVADTRRSFRTWGAASVAFAAMALVQDARPSLLVTVALLMAATRWLSTLAFLMTDSQSTRRLMFASPSRKRADARILLASLAQALLLAAPLLTAALIRT